MEFVVDGTSHQETMRTRTQITGTHGFTQVQAPKVGKIPTSCLALFLYIYTCGMYNITMSRRISKSQRDSTRCDGRDSAIKH